MRLGLFKKSKKDEKNNKYALFKYGIFFIIFFTSFVAVCVIGNYKLAFALTSIPGIHGNPAGGSDAMGYGLSFIQVDSPQANKLSWANIVKWIEDHTSWANKWQSDNLNALAWKTALGNFLSRLSYDTATYLATGDKGQAPMFNTDSIGDFITNAADYAAGDYLEALGRSNDWGEFNLCNPNLAVKARINIGLFRSRRPKEPACTFSKMLDNWDQELQDPNFLNKFQDMFNPWSNDFGIALTLQSGMEQRASQKANEAAQKYISSPFKDLTDKISGKIKTPASLVGERAKIALNKSTGKEENFTNNPIADAIGVFINTLIGKLINQWFDRGLVRNFPDNSYDWGKLSYLTDYNSGSSKGGINAAKERFRTLVKPQFKERGNYDILSELVSCPDPTKAGPTNCVITDNFRRAITNKMTVGEAMRQGYLNPEGVFGFLAGGRTDNPPEPAYYEGYPYRSMVILRKFRILPVGWELAAEWIKNGNVRDSQNLEDLVNCFSADDDYGDASETHSWCEGLVDPNWVLKAPLNYCRREGPGPEIMSEQTTGQGENSQLNISRNDNYCADEQTCIVEGEDDSCDYYGYCTEERRKWDFNAESCDPNYNTCQTFRGRDGQTASYLENTLDYTGCAAENVGCLGYCEDYDYASSTFVCTASAGDKVYLDKEAEACSANGEGCHEFIRTKDGLGSNLLHNSSFEDEANLWPELSGMLINNDAYHGVNSYQINSDLSKSVAVGPAGNSLAGKTLTFSLYAKNCTDGDELFLETATTTIIAGSDWQFYQVAFTYPLGFAGNFSSFGVQLLSPPSTCQIDAVKLEVGNTATAYSDYREQGLTYLKLAPDYLNCDGVDDPAECDNYVRFCTAYDEGCNLFTSLTDGMSVPAKVTNSDYCPAECVGYDEYLQTETNFDDQQTADFIPKMAKRCSSQSVGCDEFTNLDKLGEGAEAREYYKELKQCQKPDASCADFYTWEGSAETGYQLKTYSLRSDGSGGPYLTNPGTYDGMTCASASDYNTIYNPMCREFYNKSGVVFYRFYPYVVTCSDNCHPYRRTDKNIDPSITAQGALDLCDNVASDGDTVCWDNIDNVAYSCKNGGVWNHQHEACIYNAIPGEGIKCAAAQAGCREYSGNAGANMRVLFTDSFEFGTVDNWEVSSGEVNPSTESLIVGQHSLFASGTDEIYKTVGNLVDIDKNYVLSFIAKSSAANSFVQIGFGSSTSASIPVSIPFTIDTANIGGEWKQYKFNLINLNNTAGDYAISPEEKIFIIANNNDFYIDDIRLTEITDRYYLIKNDWNLPEACLEDANGNSVPADYNLGCDAYRDQNNETYYLRRFSHLCSDSAVGCELMIDTHNYSNYTGNTFNPGDPGQEIVPADNYVYAVYDSSKRCNAGDKGCQLLGKPYNYTDDVLYSNLYLKNDPDKYENQDGSNNVLCQYAEDGCEAYTFQGGAQPKYFKTPSDQVCEWRQEAGVGTGGYNWFKKKVKFCDSDNDGLATSSIDKFCLSDSDCEDGEKCLVDDNDYACSFQTSPFSSIGIGGYGNIVHQPTEDTSGYNWTGLCPAAQAGCTEYIDPVSKFSSNIIFNADFSQDVDGDGIADGWIGGSQNIQISPDTLYRFAGESGVVNSMTVSCDSGQIFEFTSANVFNPAPISSRILSFSGTGNTQSALLYMGDVDGCSVSINNTSGSKIELKQAVVAYELKDKIDDSGCNGQVDFEKGCVLFNERAYDGSSLIGLNWDADLTINDNQGVPPQVGLADEQNSNLILKVSPDRTCNKWLACRSYIKDENDNPVCFDIGLCDSVDDNGNCDNFIIPHNPPEEQVYTSALTGKYQNADGYVKVGWSPSSLNNNYYPLNEMKQEGEVAQVPNGNFEWYGSNKYPLGWTPYGTSSDLSWTKNLFSVINNPITAQTEGVKYPDEGKSFLKFSPSSNLMESEFIDVEPNAEYVLSADVNTINFHPGTGFDNVAVTVMIRTYDNQGSLVSSSVYPGSTVDFISCGNISQPWKNGCGISFKSGNDWIKKSIKFQVGNRTKKIKVSISGGMWWGGVQCCDLFSGDGACPNDSVGDYNYYPSGKCIDRGDITFTKTSAECPAGGSGIYPATADANSCAGNVYIDDIKLKPALKNKNSEDIVQTCRLYPETDALSCDYYEDSGKHQKGWPGYCLEYDRYPGDPDTCLMWYPIDRVKGDGIEEGAGYQDRVPLYYSIGRSFEPTEIRATPPDTFTLISGAVSADFYPMVNLGLDRLPPIALNRNFITSISFTGNPVGAGPNIMSIPYVLTPENGFLGNGAAGYNPCVDNSICQCGSEGSTLDNFCLRAIFDSNDMISGFRYGYYDKPKNHTNFQITGVIINYRRPYASQIAQTVTPVGQNKFWSGRVYKGSDYSFPCNIGLPGTPQTCDYLSDYNPFGSIVPPTGDKTDDYWSIISNPYEWDSKTGENAPEGNQPLYYERPDTSLQKPYQPRMGQLLGEDRVKRLFAQSYGTWHWDDASSHYVKDDGNGWSPPKTVCQFDSRTPSKAEITGAGLPLTEPCVSSGCLNEYISMGINNCYDACMHSWGRGGYCGCTGICNTTDNCCNCDLDWCAYPPQILNIKVNQILSTDVRVNNTQFVNLTFNSVVDAQQLPLVMYAVDWGDNEKTVVSGVEMRDRANADNPHSLYHLYSYWDLKAKEAQGVVDVHCADAGNDFVAGVSCPATSNCCAVQPSVKIKDNWGWCNNGVDGDPCPDGGYEIFGALPAGNWIIVTQD